MVLLLISVTFPFQMVLTHFEPMGKDEEKAVSVAVTADMTKQDVVNKILDLVK